MIRFTLKCGFKTRAWEFPFSKGMSYCFPMICHGIAESSGGYLGDFGDFGESARG